MIRKLVGKRIGYFLNRHERSFRTEIILVPALVVTIKVFSDLMKDWWWPYQLIGTITTSLLLYLGGMFLLILIGDKLWHDIIRRKNPVDTYQGILFQYKGADGRRRAVSRIFYDEFREQYIYRGIAYGDGGSKPAAAWEMSLSNSERIGSNLVMYFIGKSTISEELNEYNPDKFENHVFSILYFSGKNVFDGGGFDYERKPQRAKDLQNSFPISGQRLDIDYVRDECISESLLMSSFSVAEEDRRRVFRYGPAGR